MPAQLGHEVAGTLRFLDSTHVKVHGDGANPAGGPEAQAMGRTKGGLNTKIHVAVDNKARPAAVALSAGHEADITLAPEVIAGLTCACIVADKAYDSNAFRTLIADMGSKTCIPPRATRIEPMPYSKHTYKKRHRVESFFQKIKRYRRAATRHDKLTETCFGFVLLAILAVELLT